MDLNKTPDGDPLFSPREAQAIQDHFFQLVCVMARLRAACPWDRQQTPQSLKKYLLEETYEVLEAIEGADWQGLRDELGDFVFQWVFQTQIQAEAGRFGAADVLAAIVDKMIRRHPHVFGEEPARNAEEVAANWERIKQREKGPRTSRFDGFAKGMPALLESYKIGKKAARAGFDWSHPEQVVAKIEEEIEEIRQAHAGGDFRHLQEELGDLLFAVANLVRKYGSEPEETLRLANQKFIRRFRTMERLARETGEDLEDLDLDRQEALWNEAKNQEKPAPGAHAEKK